MAPTLDITIPTTSVSTTSKPYTIYNISLRQPLRNYVLQKRFSEFNALHNDIVSQSNIAPPAPFPSKSWFKSTTSSPALTETRRHDLEQYLKAINEASDPRWRSCSAWRIFLNLPNSASESGAGTKTGPSTRAGDLRSPITDPTVWLDVHRDLQSELREARIQLTKRDQADATQTQHEAAAKAKASLVRSTTMQSALDGGLGRMSGNSNGTAQKQSDQSNQKPGEGEIRRRKDLLNKATKERTGLEQLLNAAPAHSTSLPGAFPDSTTEVKDTLLRPSNDRTQTSPKTGRVLGAPLKETDRTRELDNAGVLQLQKQLMQEQDEDVTDLTKVVQRMRDMGVQINDELQLQNEMLNMLDQDVDRTGTKIDIARKRIKKIK